MLLIPLIFSIVVATAQASVSLQDAYKAALKRSETLSSQEKLMLIAEERYDQAKGNILPNLSGRASYMIQDRPADPLAATFFPREQPEVKLTLRQPIFRGLREFAALRQYDSLSRAEKHARDRATALLYNDVVQTFHSLLTEEQDVKNIKAQLELYDERNNELAQRVRAGTSSQTDLITLRASRATVRAQLETAQANLSAARAAFAFVTGLNRDTELSYTPSAPPAPRAIDEYLKSIEKRPDVLDIGERAEAADAAVSFAKGAHFPTIDLSANYYFKRQSDVYRGIDWDVMAELTLPIFSGGVTAAQVSESALQRERAELEKSRAMRLAEQEVRTLYDDYGASLKSIEALEESLQLSEKNYRLLMNEYRRGLTRNLDVLQALLSSQEARRSLLRARLGARVNWARLQTAAGIEPGKELP